MEDNKIKTYTGYEPSEDELKMEMAIFADGSRIVPRISTQQGRRYVIWRDNGDATNTDYPLKLLELYNNSSLHHSILDMKADAIGGGLEMADPNDPLSGATLQFINTKNPFGLDCNEINKRLALDLTIFNGLSSQIVYRKDWKKVDYVHHLEYHKVRCQTPDNEGMQYGYFWAFDWTLYRPSRLKWLPKYDIDTAGMNKAEYQAIFDRIQTENNNTDTTLLNNFISSGNTQMYVYKKYQPNAFYYPLPDYVGTIPAIETDILSDIYAQSSLTNGMDTGMVITILQGQNNAEDQKNIRRILKSYSGARKAGKPVVLTTPSWEEAPKLEPMANTNSLAAKYKTINESVQQKILSGHRIPNSSMVGIQTAGKLGATNETTSAEEIFFNKYIRPRQEILEKFWNEILAYNGLGKVKIINTNVFNEAAIESKAGDIVDTTKIDNSPTLIQ